MKKEDKIVELSKMDLHEFFNGVSQISAILGTPLVSTNPDEGEVNWYSVNGVEGLDVIYSYYTKRIIIHSETTKGPGLSPITLAALKGCMLLWDVFVHEQKGYEG